MRFKMVLASALIALAALIGATQSSQAGHAYRGFERYAHVNYDPYTYRYQHRGYYPYYNSGHWRPAHEVRKRRRYRNRIPKYYSAWGYPKRDYRHRDWHNRRHGRHHRHHW